MKPWSLTAMLITAPLGLAVGAILVVLSTKAADYALAHEFNMVWFSVAVLSSWFVVGLVISWLRPSGYLGAALGVGLGWLALCTAANHAGGSPRQLWLALVFAGIVAAGETAGRMARVLCHRTAKRGAKCDDA